MTTVVPVSAPADGRVPMPDVRGLGVRDAVRALSRTGLTPRVRGTGIVVSQSPEPGVLTSGGATAVLELRREAGPVAAPGREGGEVP
jgi:hypothetical protein